MTERTTRSTVVFHHPFRMAGHDGLLPAGRYDIEIDEEPVPGLSFIAYRRTRTSLFADVAFGAQSARQMIEITQEELTAALAKDSAADDERVQDEP